MAVAVLRQLVGSDNSKLSKLVRVSVTISYSATDNGILPRLFNIVDADVHSGSIIAAWYNPIDSYDGSNNVLEAEDDAEFDDITVKVRDVVEGSFNLAVTCPYGYLVGQRTFIYQIQN